MKAMKRRVSALLLVVIMTAFSACGKKPEPSPTPTPTMTPTATPIPTAEPVVVPTPTPVPKIGPTVISLYKNRTDEKLRRRFSDLFGDRWVAGSEIARIECLAGDAPEIKDEGRAFPQVFGDFWNAYTRSDECRICYRVQMETRSGEFVSKVIRSSEDAEDIKSYLNISLFDVQGKELKNAADTGIAASIRITAGSEIGEVLNPVIVTAYVYHSEDQFDDFDRYLGDVSCTVKLYNTDPGAEYRDVYEELDYTTAVDQTEEEVSEKTASVVPVTVKDGNKRDGAPLFDRDNSTGLSYRMGDTFTVSSETDMAGLYFIWGSSVPEYKLRAGGQEIECKSGFLHDYVAFETPVKNVTVTVYGKGTLCDLSAYGEGKLPDSVQVWNAPCENADMLVFAAHASDESLYFGGPLAFYGAVMKKRVQIVYMNDYAGPEPSDYMREHEKLNCLWTMGVRNYPVNMPAERVQVASAKEGITEESLRPVVAEMIRRFKPLVVITHDEGGEYGNYDHVILHRAVTEAVQQTMREDYCPESVSAYGTWDVPKTYIHLYGDNAIRMNLRIKENALSGKTVLNTLKQAYEKNASQQGLWFYVSDNNDPANQDYSCADFGLFRTTVGKNIGSDMFENLLSYAAQEKKVEKEAYYAELTREAELSKQAELTRAAEEAEEQHRQQELLEEEERLAAEDLAREQKAKDELRKTIYCIIGAIALLLVLYVAAVLTAKLLRRKHRKDRDRRLREKAHEENVKHSAEAGAEEEDYR